MVRTATIAESLEARRRALGMSQRVLARRCGVSQATVQRVLAGSPDAALANVEAIARALGMHLGLVGQSESAFRTDQARAKAQWLVRSVQGTSGLEAQAVSPDVLDAMVEQTVHELLAGPARRLWED